MLFKFEKSWNYCELFAERVKFELLNETFEEKQLESDKKLN